MGVATSDSVQNHITEDTAAHAASAISVTNPGHANAQAAITAALNASGSGTATTADAVSVTDTGGYFTGSNVETVLQEVGGALDVGSHNLDSHSDVDLVTTAPVVGDSLYWDGTNWVPRVRPWNLAPHSIETITAVVIAGDSVCTENNFDLRRVSARVQAPSTSGSVTINIHRGTSGTGAPTLTLIGTVTILANQYRAVNLGVTGHTLQQDEFIRATVTAAGTGATGLSIFYRGLLL
jgi:hypothetical protein